MTVLRRLSTLASILVIVAFVIIVMAVWLALHALDAGGRLAAVRDDIARVRDDLVNARDPSADLRQAQADARAAQHDTHDPVWAVTSWIPPIHTIRGIASATDELASGALPHVVAVGTTIEPSKLRVKHNKIALPPLRRALPALTAADTALQNARDRVAALSGGWGLLGDIRDKVLSEFTSFAGSIDDAARFARAGPSMLGANGTRRYFVAIENNAEARATGGLVAGYSIVTAHHGTIHVVARGNDGDLQYFIPTRPTPVTPLSQEYLDVYGNWLPAQRWITSNLSPNFPDAAYLWAHMWQAQSGHRIDGVFGVDPFALQAMLGAAGPVTVPGYAGVYNGTNLANYIEAQEYVDFAGTSQADQHARKDFISKVAHVVIKKLLSGSGSAQAITTALGRSAGGGHLALWSSVPSEQTQLSGTPLAGELPASHAPFAAVHVDNATGSKLDYYLDRSLSYHAGSCSGDYRSSTIAVRLTNNAPLHGLPPYVRSRADRSYGGIQVVEKKPRNKMFVFVHATAGAALRSATLDGHPVRLSEGVERAHAVFSLELTLDPGVPRTLQLGLQEPTAAGPATTLVQPMARAQHTAIDVPTCG
jgi:hypothetical protein